MWVIKERFCTDINDSNQDLEASFGAHHFAKTTVGTHREPPLPLRCAVLRPFPTLLVCPLRHLIHDDWFCWLLLLSVMRNASESTKTNKVRQLQQDVDSFFTSNHRSLTFNALPVHWHVAPCIKPPIEQKDKLNKWLFHACLTIQFPAVVVLFQAKKNAERPLSLS